MILARRGIITGLLGTLAGCSPAALLNTTVSRKGYTLEADVPYGLDPRQKLDLYRPETPRTDGKAVIFFYGGSWDSGTKSDYLFVAQAPLPPVLLLHGEADRTVYPRNTARLAAAWKAAGGSAEMKLYPEVDHIDILAAMSSFLRARAPTLADSMAFIDRH